jgi:hypothetical protein
MKKLDIPCGEECVAIIMNKVELKTISDLLHSESFEKELMSDYAKRFEKEFNQAAGLVKEPEKPAQLPAVPEEFADVPF